MTEYPILCPRCGHGNSHGRCQCGCEVMYPDLAQMSGTLVCEGCRATLSFSTYYVPVNDDPQVVIMEEEEE